MDAAICCGRRHDARLQDRLSCERQQQVRRPCVRLRLPQAASLLARKRVIAPRQRPRLCSPACCPTPPTRCASRRRLPIEAAAPRLSRSSFAPNRSVCRPFCSLGAATRQLQISRQYKFEICTQQQLAPTLHKSTGRRQLTAARRAALNTNSSIDVTRNLKATIRRRL